MSAADALQALGAVLLVLAAGCAVWTARCARPLDLTAAGFCFAMALAAAMVALRLSHVGQGLALYFPIVLLLALAASPGAHESSARAPLRAARALVLGGVGLMAGLMLIAGPIVRAAPVGAVRTRRALLESDLMEGMQAALLTFNAGWLVSALGGLAVVALCVVALLAEGRGPAETGRRS